MPSLPPMIGVHVNTRPRRVRGLRELRLFLRVRAELDAVDDDHELERATLARLAAQTARLADRAAGERGRP